MAQRKYRANLDNINFPLLSRDMGRTVILPQPEEYRREANEPTIAYCENVMPTMEGLVSITTDKVLKANPIADDSQFIVRVYKAYTESGISNYVGFASDGKTYYTSSAEGQDWIRIMSPFFNQPTWALDRLTVTTLKNVTYFYVTGVGGWSWDNGSFVSVPFTQIVEGTTWSPRLLTSAGNYLIAASGNKIYWSSLIDPIDFEPSLVTGAGNGFVTSLIGSITHITATATGFIVHSAANAVVAELTGNSNNPFRFVAIKDAKGLKYILHIAGSNQLDSVYIITPTGLQTYSSRKAKSILPEVSDFINQTNIERFDPITKEINLIANSSNMRTGLSFISARYLVISYGFNSGGAPYEAALIYDTVLKKLGKILIQHHQAFEWSATFSSEGMSTIAFITAGGDVEVIIPAYSPSYAKPLADEAIVVGKGVLLFAGFQQSRTRMTTLLEVSLEDIYEDAKLDVVNLATLTGKSNGFNEVVHGAINHTEDGIRSYNFRHTAKSHAILLEGEFKLNTIEFTYTTNGKR